MDRISYVFHRPNDKPGAIFSLSPDHSDSFENQTILNALVGTLVKFNASGRLEPYLASSWSKSNDGRRWEFQLRQGLTCEDGTHITAPAYVEKLGRQLKKYASETKVMAFDQLVGWQDFLKNGDSSLLGLSAVGADKIVFEFVQEPEELLEFLRMVYFGFWCDANFIDGKFRDDGRFLSSSSYRLKANESGRKITIEKNPGWYSVTPESASEVEFTARNVEVEVGSSTRTIVRVGVSTPELRDIDQFHKVRTAPVILSAMILSPWTTSGFFKSETNRKVFQTRLRKTHFPPQLDTEGIYPSPHFYSNAPIKTASIEPSVNSYEPAASEILVSLPTRLGKSASDYVRTLIMDLLAEVSPERIRFENVDSSDPNMLKKLTSNKHFDIRVSSVDIGGSITNSIIDMMFCTSMGVSFPDPHGRVCRMVTDYNYRGKEADQAYVDEFNRILVEDAFVLPLFHSGLTTLFSKDFDPKSIPTGSAHPRFEDFRFTE